MSKILKKLEEKQGAALVIALCILMFLVLMSISLALAIPTAYKVDDSSRKLEQGNLYAKAGLSIVVDNLMKISDDDKRKEALDKLIAQQPFSGVIDSTDYTVPPFTITFQTFTKNSDTVVKVISTVEYEGKSTSAYRYLYRSSSHEPDINIVDDAIHSDGTLDYHAGINGRITLDNLVPAATSEYRSIYVRNDFTGTGSGQGKYVVVREYEGGKIVSTSDDSTSSSKAGDILVKGNINMENANMTPIIGSSNEIVFSGSDPIINNFSYTETGGKIECLGFLKTMANGYMHPECLVTYGGETVDYTTDGIDFNDLALLLVNTNATASNAFCVGKRNLKDIVHSESEVPCAIYSKGNAYISLGTSCEIYGNVYIDGDLYYEPVGSSCTLTIYGNLYVNGRVYLNHNTSKAGPIVTKCIEAKDNAGADVKLGGHFVSKISYLDGSTGLDVTTVACDESRCDSAASSTHKVGFPDEGTISKDSSEKISEAVGETQTMTSPNYDRVAALKNNSSTKMKLEELVGYYDGGNFIYYAPDTEPTGYAPVFIDGSNNRFAMFRVTKSCYLEGGIGDRLWKYPWTPEADPTKFTAASLYLDASEWDVDTDGPVMEVVLGGNWKFARQGYVSESQISVNNEAMLSGTNQDTYKALRLYVNDNDKHGKKVIINVYLENGTQLYFTRAQVYVPGDELTAEQRKSVNGELVWRDYNAGANFDFSSCGLIKAKGPAAVTAEAVPNLFIYVPEDSTQEYVENKQVVVGQDWGTWPPTDIVETQYGYKTQIGIGSTDEYGDVGTLCGYINAPLASVKLAINQGTTVTGKIYSGAIKSPQRTYIPGINNVEYCNPGMISSDYSLFEKISLAVASSMDFTLVTDPETGKKTISASGGTGGTGGSGAPRLRPTISA